MTQLDLETGHPVVRERLFANAVEMALAGTIAIVQATWLGLLGYGAWRLIMG